MLAVFANLRNSVYTMLKKSFRWMWQHRKLTIAMMLAALLLALNLVAYNHAWAMTHFRDGGSKTSNPEDLSILQKANVLVLGVNIPRPANHADPGSQGLIFQTRTFQGRHGICLEAWHIPHPKAKGLVLLLHGYAACKANLLREARAFHDLGYATILLDMRGSGGSEGNQTTIGVYEADDLAAVIRSVQADDPEQPLILYGQSMGSVAILRAISENQVQAKAVIVECPFDRLLSTVENRFSAMGMPAFPFAQLLVFWGGVQNDFNGFKHNPVEYAQAIHCPVLLMHGENDPRVTAAQAQAVFENLAGEKRCESFPAVGHQSYVTASPDLWRQRISEFLARYVQ